MTNKIQFLFGKGVIETIRYIEKSEKAGYYELYKQGFVVSRQAFSNLLKTLEKNEIASRKVIENRPPKVEYSLTSKGKEIAALLKRMNEIV
ncbi:MAG: winged helix-turn-helix transcriptional regulator [Candidatus Bathyarchaeota archaeon]|nr:winged helix-turn-helix transcriptional regulator [Candidatus Bathyarchaeota archaeon]